MSWGSRVTAVVCAGALAVSSLGAGWIAKAQAPNRGRTGEWLRLSVTSTASTLVDRGVAAAAPSGADAAGYREVPAPGLRFISDDAQATAAPWIDSNGWRFQRGLEKASYTTLPAGSAPLAAAEAFAFDVAAILNPDSADVEDLGAMLQFLKTHAQAPLPIMANIGVVDDDAPQMGEVLNLLTRRNLLYRVVAAPDRSLDLTVQLGTDDFPRTAAANPSELAARVRAKLGDDKRLVRVYGTSTVIARLTGDGTRARLHLLSYSGRNRQAGRQQNVRIRLRGRYTPTRVAAFGSGADAALADVEQMDDATEFSVPTFSTLAIVDLHRR